MREAFEFLRDVGLYLGGVGVLVAAHLTIVTAARLGNGAARSMIAEGRIPAELDRVFDVVNGLHVRFFGAVGDD